MSEENNEVPVKRPRGNPNFKKKPVPENERVVVSTTGLPKLPDQGIELTSNGITDNQVWVMLFASIIQTFNGTATGNVLEQGAKTADIGLELYKQRFPDDADPS